MLTEERKLHILKKVNTEKSVTVQELTDELGVSESTIRRDITALSREGKLIKVFGGAVALDEPPSSEELSVIVKESINKDEKLRIAKYAASLIMPGDYVFIDSGTTTEYMIDYITVVGADAILHIQKYHFTKGFFGTNGINIELGYTTPDVREALIKRVAIQNTQIGSRFVLADHDKFGHSSAVTFADFGGTVVITDKNPGKLYMKSLDIKIVDE